MQTRTLEEYIVFLDDEGYIIGAETEVDGEIVPVVLAHKDRGHRYAKVTKRTKFTSVSRGYYDHGAFAFFCEEDMTWEV